MSWKQKSTRKNSEKHERIWEIREKTDKIEEIRSNQRNTILQQMREKNIVKTVSKFELFIDIWSCYWFWVFHATRAGISCTVIVHLFKNDPFEQNKWRYFALTYVLCMEMWFSRTSSSMRRNFQLAKINERRSLAQKKRERYQKYVSISRKETFLSVGNFENPICYAFKCTLNGKPVWKSICNEQRWSPRNVIS